MPQNKIFFTKLALPIKLAKRDSDSFTVKTAKTAKLKNFGVYLYGSEASGTSQPFSDVDLIVLTEDSCSNAEATKQLVPTLKMQFPKWKDKKFDIAVASSKNQPPKKAAEIMLLAYLHQTKAQVIFGTHLLPTSFSPTWQDYLMARKQRVQDIFNGTRGADPRYIYLKAIETKSTNVIYALCFEMILFQKVYSSNKEWIFLKNQLKEFDIPLLNDVDSLIRDQWNYKTPTTKEELTKLKSLCLRITLLAERLKREHGFK